MIHVVDLTVKISGTYNRIVLLTQKLLRDKRA